jgi:SAM-dependent methyltransferase
MKLLKRVERYVSAIFTLGRVKTLAKEARQEVQQTQPRVDRLEEITAHQGRHGEAMGRDLAAIQTAFDLRTADLRRDLDGVLQDIGGRMMHDVDSRVQQLSEWARRHENLAEDIVAEYRQEAEILGQTYTSQTALLARIFSDLSRRMDGRTEAPTPGGPAMALPSNDGFEAFKDNFYHRLENRYRGAPEEIARRLKVYLPDVEAAWLRTGQKPAMDIGCGRGEWLGLLKEHGITGFGIDTNAVQIQEAQDAGLDVRLGDALQALVDQPDNSICMLSAHHLIEHLPFDAVAWITREALRVLAPGGLLLFETPNTRNVLVGASTFHTDPTHLKPMPEQVMEILLETAGFDPIDIRHLNPHARFGEFLDRADMNDEMAALMFGPQDLAILGSKPKTVGDA